MAAQVGAAVLGVRVKPTIKEVRADGLVVRTLERANLWEVQTPQARTHVFLDDDTLQVTALECKLGTLFCFMTLMQCGSHHSLSRRRD